MSYSCSNGFYNDNFDIVIGMFSGTVLVIELMLAALAIVSMWFIFTKAGEKGWAAIVPFYNLYVLFKISWGGSGWKFLLMFIPIANIVIGILTYVYLGQSFKKSGGFIVGLVLLPVVFLPLLGFGSSKYVGPRGIAQ